MVFIKIKHFDKKGTDKILAVYWFAILIIVVTGIFAMVYIFYNHPYDTREIEAGILANNVADCISEQGKIKSDLVSKNKFNENFKNNFLENCHLNFKVEDEFNWQEQGQYYFKINFYTPKDFLNSIFNIEEGNKNLFLSCEIQKNGKYDKLSKCVEKRLYLVDSNNEQYLIKILSVIRKSEKNVKL